MSSHFVYCLVFADVKRPARGAVLHSSPRADGEIPESSANSFIPPVKHPDIFSRIRRVELTFLRPVSRSQKVNPDSSRADGVIFAEWQLHRVRAQFNDRATWRGGLSGNSRHLELRLLKLKRALSETELKRIAG